MKICMVRGENFKGALAVGEKEGDGFRLVTGKGTQLKGGMFKVISTMNTFGEAMLDGHENIKTGCGLVVSDCGTMVSVVEKETLSAFDNI